MRSFLTIPLLVVFATTIFSLDENGETTPAIPVRPPNAPTGGDGGRVLETVRHFTGNFSFYGKVVDQSGVAVVGIKMIGEAGRISSIGGSVVPSQDEYEATTDANGCFVLKDMKGFSFSVRPGPNDSYEIERWRGLNYNTVKPVLRPEEISVDGKPYILQAWKRRGAEPMACLPFAPARAQNVKIKSGSEWINLNLKIGKVVEDHEPWDMRVALRVVDGAIDRIVTGSKNICVEKLPVGMRMVMEVREGGLQQTILRFPYEAPIDGYEKSIVLDWGKFDYSDGDGGYARASMYWHSVSDMYGSINFGVEFDRDVSPEAVSKRALNDWTIVLRFRQILLNPKGRHLEPVYPKSKFIIEETNKQIVTWEQWVTATGLPDERILFAPHKDH